MREVPTTSSTTRYSGLRVLLLDDASVNNKILTRRLLPLLPGAVVTSVETAAKALEHLQIGDVIGDGPSPSSFFDIFFVDELLSNEKDALRGTDVTRILRAHEAAVATRAMAVGLQPASPVIAVGCSGNAGTSEHDSCALESGQDAVLAKPLSSELLKTTLFSLLAARGYT